MKLEFLPVSLADQEVYLSHLARCPGGASDYSFVNVWSWAVAHGLEMAVTGGLVFLRQNHPRRQYWAPVGDWGAADWPAFGELLFELGPDMVRVPEPLVQLWQSVFGDAVQAFPDRDQFDYLYDASDLAGLAGNRYHKKRNLLQQFKKNYDFQYVDMTCNLADAALALQGNWCVWRECDSDAQLAAENQAIERVFSMWNDLDGLMGGGLMVDGDLVAYTIGERLFNDTLVIHFEKGDTAYKGVYQAINQMFVAHVLAGPGNPLKWVNREQDLGDQGLRRAKESYHPVEFLKKYRVAWNAFKST